MTATFGKLEQETLTLEPGLNVFQADNEWGKSTWCAFVVAMLYGLDTRAKSTKAALADKERYAPWSGTPMAGRMDLCWRDRDITIERRTRGRVPLGEFRAYETQTGLAVPELTAANCGQLILGVEQSVFRRAGFIRLQELPVTQDDALRRRLNALVTTGDESGDGERLERSLRELKNKCRFNRTGRIPQAEAELEALEGKLRELDGLEYQSQKLQQRIEELEHWTKQLENHLSALRYTAAEQDADRVARARQDLDRAEQNLRELESRCAKLPDREKAQTRIRELREYQEQWHSLQMELAMLPRKPEKPEVPVVFTGMDPEKAREMVCLDTEYRRALDARRPGWSAFAAAVLGMLFAITMAFMEEWLLAGGGAALLLTALALGIRSRRRQARERDVLTEKYGSSRPEEWQQLLDLYIREQRDYMTALLEYRAGYGDLDARMAALRSKRQSLCGAQSDQRVLEVWQQVLRCWEECDNARRENQQARAHLQTLQTMAKKASPPASADMLHYSDTETTRLISEALAERQRLHSRLGQHQGRMDALGSRMALEEQRQRTERRLRELEDIYAATDLALSTLAQAKRELQRRFAPRIAKRAQELLERMTGGRYCRLTLGEDFGLASGTGQEALLYDALWRSDGTVDQLYLALRLAVAQELTPDAPLVLDDALVRFDDTRLKAVLDILLELAQTRQILLFTCQEREKNYISSRHI